MHGIFILAFGIILKSRQRVKISKKNRESESARDVFFRRNADMFSLTVVTSGHRKKCVVFAFQFTVCTRYLPLNLTVITVFAREKKCGLYGLKERKTARYSSASETCIIGVTKQVLVTFS